MKKKIHITCAGFGSGYSVNKEIPYQVTDDYEISIKCYDDNNSPSRGNSLHPRTKGKIPKMLDWMNYDADYYIWMDSPFNIVSNNLGNLIEYAIEDADICLIKHPWNCSIFKELCDVEDGMRNGNPYLISRYNGESMVDQVNSYIGDPTFVDDKLFALGFFIYSKNLIRNRDYNLLTDWFFHNIYWSVQDQLSLPYLLHKHKTNYKVLDNFDIFNNEFVKYN